MNKIVDYLCTYDNSTGIREEVTKELGLIFPDAYKDWKTMTQISLALKKHDNADFCELPFCHTVEGEAMGGIINYGDGHTGPRAKEYLCRTPEDILALPNIDYEKGRINEVLQACAALHRQGECVVLDVSGPFTILNVLADASITLKWLRKQPEQMKQIFKKIGKELLRYMEYAQQAGVTVISYADSTGGLNIIGPKQMETTVEQFTYPLLKEADARLSKNILIQLCPKTAFALVGTGKATWKEEKLNSEEMAYGAACGKLVGKARFTGQTCIKNIKYRVKGKIQTLELV